MTLLRVLGIATAGVVAVRVLDWLLAPALLPLVVIWVLVATFILAVGGPGVFRRSGK